ncbi:MAG: hypothetical protein ACK4M3_06800 [Pyrobaculum sp.]
MYVQRFSPVGEYIRLVVMRRLAQGPATLEELNEAVKRAVERAGVRYNWQTWPELLRQEVVIRGGVVELSERGRWVYQQTREIVEEYIKKTLGL